MAKNSKNQKSWVVGIIILVIGLVVGYSLGVYAARRVDTQTVMRSSHTGTQPAKVCNCPMIPAGASSGSVCNCR